MGEETSYRIFIFHKAWNIICQLNITNKNELYKFPLQLTLTQSNLLNYSMIIYANETINHINNYQINLSLNISNNLKQSKQLTNSIHHYLHGLIHTTYIPQTILNNFNISELKQYNYELLEMNLLLFQQTNSTDILEYMKLMIETSQHIITDINQSINDRLSLGYHSMSILHELLNKCHIKQRYSISYMISQLYLELGLIYLNNNNNLMKSNEMFEISVNITKSVSHIIGYHTLITPMMYFANNLAMLHKYNQSYEIFEDILLIINNYSNNNLNKIMYLINYSIALIENNDCMKGIIKLNEAKSILIDINYDKYSTSYIKINEYLTKCNYISDEL